MVDLNFCPRCGARVKMAEKFGCLRPTCIECGFIVFLDPKVVAVVLVERDNKILLGKRNLNPGKGLWSFPSGYVNRGEKVEEAAVREVKEETNLDICLTGLLGVYSETGSPIILIVFGADICGGIEMLQVQPEEVSELDFFGLEELPELAFPFDQNILLKWANKERVSLD